MTLWFFILAFQLAYNAVQIAICILSNLRERGEDRAFAGEKFHFRS